MSSIMVPGIAGYRVSVTITRKVRSMVSLMQLGYIKV